VTSEPGFALPSSQATTSGRCHTDHCITCNDDGVPMRVLRIDRERGLALCEDEGGARSSVEIALVDAEVGDTVLVHAGTALA
jgi:hydrogenase expression/formation protein HypC